MNVLPNVIWGAARGLALWCAATAWAAEPTTESGFVSIFDGKGLDGWTVMPTNSANSWTVEAIPVIEASGGGSIVNVSSVAGISGASNLSAYSASKHAVIGLTKSGALEFAVQGIRCNAICPSPVDTRMMRSLEDGMKTDGLTQDDMKAMIAMSIPLGRYGEPSEVADLMTFLLSDDSKFLSGTAIPIDGAMKAR